MRARVGVSACLLGQRVRWDGRDKRARTVAEVLAAQVELVPVCPEVELGMGVPREPLRLVRRDGRTHMIAEPSGEDWTARMEAFATARLERLEVDGFVLKSRSPSCGLGLPAERGLFAAAVLARWPDLPVVDEERLVDEAAVATFVAAVTARRDR